MMSVNLKANIHLLLFLGDKRTDKLQRSDILITLKDFQIQALSEVVVNFLAKNITSDKETIKLVKKDVEFLRRIGDKDLSLTSRKRTLKHSNPGQRKSLLRILEKAVHILKKL